MKAFYVYMMTNRSRVVLYTGITYSLMRRVWQHQSGEIEGFTKTYRLIDSCITSVSMIRETRSRVKRRSRLAPREEECVGRKNESEVDGFITNALSAYETYVVFFR